MMTWTSVNDHKFTGVTLTAYILDPWLHFQENIGFLWLATYKVVMHI